MILSLEMILYDFPPALPQKVVESSSFASLTIPNWKEFEHLSTTFQFSSTVFYQTTFIMSKRITRNQIQSIESAKLTVRSHLSKRTK